MPLFELQGPDGKTYEVDAPDMNAAASAFGEMSAPPSSLRDQTQAFAGNALDGIPVIGGYLKAGVERARAGVDSLMNDTKFSDELVEAQGSAKANTANYPWTATAGKITGGVVGTAPLVAMAAGLMGAGAAGLRTRALASMASGGAIGGADAAVRSGGDGHETLQGAAIGGGAGLAAPLAAAGVGAGVRKIADIARNYLAQSDNALTGLSAGAVRYARETFASPTQQAQFLREIQRLGPEAMLADVSPDWQGVARGAAGRPGQRDAIVGAIQARDAGRNQRLTGDLDANLGRPVVPSRVEAELKASRDALGPRYGEVFRGERAVNTEGLAGELETAAVELRGPAQQAATRARGMLNITGEDELDPSPRTLLQVRQALDGLMEGETNTKVLRQLAITRQRVDQILGDAVPGIKNVDAQFLELSRQSAGLERGRMILGNGKTAIRPQELQDEFTAAALPQGNMVGPSGVPLRVQQGTRAELDRIVGTSANDPAALQQMVKSEGDWNRDKLRTIFGQEPADNALNAIDRETTFYRTSNKITSGSDTDMSKRFGDFLDASSRPNAIPTDTTLTGATARGAQKLFQTVQGSNSEAKAQKFSEELGRLAVAQGQERDKIIRSLQQVVEIRRVAGQSTKPLEMVLENLIRGGAPAALR